MESFSHGQVGKKTGVFSHHGKITPMQSHDVPCTMGPSMVFGDWEVISYQQAMLLLEQMGVSVEALVIFPHTL